MNNVAIQVCEFDLVPDSCFFSNCLANELSFIKDNESECDESTNNLQALSNLIKSLNREIAEQERTIELQHQQIKILKESIKELERKNTFDKAYDNRMGPYSDHLKASICRLISQIPKLSQEGEGLINLILSLLLLNKSENEEIQHLRNSKSLRNLMCMLAL
jgi:uncharacterized coiled-coil protein SlyX